MRLFILPSLCLLLCNLLSAVSIHNQGVSIVEYVGTPSSTASNTKVTRKRFEYCTAISKKILIKEGKVPIDKCHSFNGGLTKLQGRVRRKYGIQEHSFNPKDHMRVDGSHIQRRSTVFQRKVMKDMSNRCTSQPGFAPKRFMELAKEIINDAQTDRGIKYDYVRLEEVLRACYKVFRTVNLKGLDIPTYMGL